MPETALAAGSTGFEGASLLRTMGRWTLAALVVNAVVGSGIFGLPATVSRLLGAAAPWAWIAGALGNGIVMLCFAEVASRFQSAGGAYLYARQSMPRLLAILVGWLAFLTRATAAAAGGNLFTVNLVEFFPAVGRGLLAAGAVISTVGFLGANFLNAPRLGFALSEHRDLPAIFGRIHPNFRTPYISILSFAFLVLILAVYGSFERSATLSAVSRLFVYGSTCVALLILRRRRPEEARFELPGGNLFAVLGIAFCLLLLSRMGRTDALLLAAVAALATMHWAAVRRTA